MIKRFKSPDISYSPKQVSDTRSTEAKQRIKEVETQLLPKIKGKKGIIVFDVKGWSNASGHFTLWDGKNLAYVGPGDHNNPASIEYYFWFMREDIYFKGGFKTRVTQTTDITFWELK